MNVINPIDLEIYWNRLISIVDEAGAALKRTSFSTVVRESNDFACVLLDENGALLAQSSLSVPGFIGTAPLSLKHFLKVFPRESLAEGDVLLTNDPWIGTGHLPDSTMAAPIFWKGKLVAFVVTVAHLSDIGGRPWSADAQEVFEEGLRIPIVKLYDRGRLNRFILDLVKYNVRVPDQVLGDLDAQVVALRVATRRVQEMLEEYGFESLNPVAQSIYDRSRQAIERQIASIPPGTYTAEVEADGWEDPVRVKATVRIEGRRISVDYSGSSPQSRYGLNESYNHTFAYTVYPFKCMLCPELPNNDGFIRMIEVNAPKGSIVNCRPPAPVGARQLVGHLLQAAIFEALAPVIPEKVQADSGTPLWTLVMRGVDPHGERSFSLILFFNGGMGAKAGRNGYHCKSFPGNISNTPIEIAESLAPVLFHCKRIDEGSGGPGTFAGGCGQIAAIESRWEGVLRVFLLTDRTRVQPKGLLGGKPGKPGRVAKNGVRLTQSKGVIELRKGDILEIGLPGGGGLGIPAHLRS